MDNDSFLWDVQPQIFKRSTDQDAIDELRGANRTYLPAGIQKKLDLVTSTHPRWNPSIALLPLDSPLSSVATYIGAVRMNSKSQKLEMPGQMPEDPPDKAVTDMDTMEIGDLKTYESALDNNSYCELILFDSELNTLCQVPVYSTDNEGRPYLHNTQDCRVLSLWGGLRIYGVRYDPEPSHHHHLWTVLLPLDYNVRTTKSLNFFLAQAQMKAMNHSESLHLTNDVVRSDNDTSRPLDGKNHMFYQDSKGSVFVFHRFYPQSLWKFVDGNRTRVEQVSSPRHGALGGGTSPTHDELMHYNLNGGKLIYIPETDELLGMVHRHRDYDHRSGNWGTHYTQAFFTLNSSYPHKILRISHEFCFQSLAREDECEAIQFSPEFERVGDTLLIPYGAMDIEAMIFTVKLSDALDMLRPLGKREKKMLLRDYWKRL